jgi:hypothetical protein
MVKWIKEILFPFGYPDSIFYAALLMEAKSSILQSDWFFNVNNSVLNIIS